MILMFFRRGKPSALSPTEAFERLNAGEIDLVDVREPGEWQQGHPEGARHIPLGDLPSRAGDLPADRPVAFICASGNRSKVATETAKRAGIDAHNVDGGLAAWQRAQLPVSRS